MIIVIRSHNFVEEIEVSEPSNALYYLLFDVIIAHFDNHSYFYKFKL